MGEEWGVRWRILGGITWFLGEQKGGSVFTENPKGGIAENFGTIQRGGSTQIFFEIKDLWDRESHQKQESSLDQKLLGGITSVK